MSQPKPRFQSFEEYLSYDDGTNKRYELFNGELIEVPQEELETNYWITSGLCIMFRMILMDSVGGLEKATDTDIQRATSRVAPSLGLELEVNGEPRNRYPDVTILRDEHMELLAKRRRHCFTIRLTMPPPLLVVEVVSSGELQRNRDYIAKRSQYQDCGVAEYWIVDPNTKTILVLELKENKYIEVGSFGSDKRVVSRQFKELNLTSAQIFESAN